MPALSPDVFGALKKIGFLALIAAYTLTNLIFWDDSLTLRLLGWQEGVPVHFPLIVDENVLRAAHDMCDGVTSHQVIKQFGETLQRLQLREHR